METDLLGHLQSALFDHMKAALLVALYDTPPEDADLPYVSFGSADLTPRHTSGGHTLYDVQQMLHVWSGHEDQLDLKSLMAETAATLETFAPTLTDCRYVGGRLLSANTSRRLGGVGSVQEGRIAFELRLATPA